MSRCIYLLCCFNDKTPAKSASKKRKRESRGEQDAVNEPVAEPSTAFVPFNYSDVDYSTFTGKFVQQEMKPLTCNTLVVDITSNARRYHCFVFQ